MNGRWPKEECVGSSNSSVSNWNMLTEWWTFPLCFIDLIASCGIRKTPGSPWCWTSSPNLSPTPFFHFLCSRTIWAGVSLWAVGSNCCTTGCVLFFTCKILRKGMQEQVPRSIFHMIKNWAASGLMSGWANPLRLFWGSGCFITPTPSCRDKGICSICDKQKCWEARDQKALCGGWPGVVGRK